MYIYIYIYMYTSEIRILHVANDEETSFGVGPQWGGKSDLQSASSGGLEHEFTVCKYMYTLINSGKSTSFVMKKNDIITK